MFIDLPPRSGPGSELVCGSIRISGELSIELNRYRVEQIIEKLRDEVHDRAIFYTPREAQVIIEQWRIEYNTFRPHSSLGKRPPVPEAFFKTFIVQNIPEVISCRGIPVPHGSNLRSGSSCGGKSCKSGLSFKSNNWAEIPGKYTIGGGILP
jgi:hypothetical protein